MLQADLPLLAVIDQPLLTFEVALGVLPGHLGRMLAHDVGHSGALQQADLRGGVAGRAGTRAAPLQDQHIPPGPCQ